jgi:hypothetical protein
MSGFTQSVSRSSTTRPPPVRQGIASDTCRWLIGLGVLVLACAANAQQRAGEVAHLQGMATAQQPGGAFRFLGRGDAVLEGDVLSTTEKGFAVVSLADGTKFTLRPSTTFALERFSQAQGAESSVMRLFKGGLRVVSGLIAKRNPAGVELRVNTATIGIRGTSFDARICGEDCRQENSAPVSTSAQSANNFVAPAVGPVVARLVQSSGEVTANQPGQASRPLAVGAALYEGDAVRTGAAGVAVIGFRDQTKVSVNPQTAIRIDGFTYKKPLSTDNMALSLLKGGLRVFTGLIGKQSSDGFSVRTRTSTIGIRGTGMDISCEGPCVDASIGEGPVAPSADASNPRKTDGLFMLTWQGGTFFVLGPLDVPLDRAGYIGGNGAPRLLDSIPDFFTDFGSPRPDGVDVDWENLFATVSPAGADGLYLFVRDGHVILADRSRIDLGVNEAGFLGPDGLARRMSPVPGFMANDPYPLPELFSGSDAQIFRMFGVTLGVPGQEICRL